VIAGENLLYKISNSNCQSKEGMSMGFNSFEVINSSNFSEINKIKHKEGKRYFYKSSDYSGNLEYSDYLEYDFSVPNKVWIGHDIRLVDEVNNLPFGSMLILAFKNSLDEVIVEFDMNAYERFFEDGRLVLICGGGAVQQSTYISELINIDDYLEWYPLISSCKIEDDVDYFKIFYRSLAAKLNINNLFKATHMHTGHAFLRNSLINAPLLFGSTKLDGFRNFYSNKPILIVAAGPSLNKQLSIIKDNQDLFLILAVDTVWPILKGYGIVPDVIFALDAFSIPSWNYNELSSDTLFAVNIGCAPGLVWSNVKNYSFTSTNELIKNLLAQMGARVDILPTGGSVATSAFKFAQYISGNPIVLVGQDLALTGGVDHADGYMFSYSDEILKSRLEDGFSVEGYYGGKVATEKQLLFYKTWYEEQIEKNPNILVINSTEGGARINGASQIPFSVVCNELRNFNIEKKSINYEFKIEDPVFNVSYIESLVSGIDELILNVEGFIDLAKEGEKLMESSLKNDDIKFSKIDSINNQIKGFCSDARTVVDAFSHVEMYEISKGLMMSSGPKNLETAAEGYLKIYLQIQQCGYLGLAMLCDVKKFYEALIIRGSFDLDLIDFINEKKPPV
jgi:hypothetical protein